jgi:uncharacterized membrane protein
MKLTRLNALGILAILVQAAAAVLVYRYAAAGPLPVHFNWRGEPNGWADRRTVALIITGMMLATGLLNTLLPIVTRGRGMAEPTGASLSAARLILYLLFPLVSLILASAAFGFGGRVSLQMGALAALMLILGVWIGKVGPNPFLGVRTYWALRSRLAWDKSNRLFGRIAFWAGLAGLVAAPFAPQPLGLQLIIATMLAGAALSIFESWRVWRADPDRQAN